MSFRRFPLPLLLLTVALTPVDPARALGGESFPGSTRYVTASQQQVSLVASSESTGRRRRGAAASQRTASGDALALVSNYLQCRAGGIAPASKSRDAWDAFYAWCDGSIRRYASRCRLRGADVDDCAQEVWRDLLASLRSFRLDETRGRFSSWLYRVVQSKATDFKRRQARRPSVAISAKLAETLADDEMDPAMKQEGAEEQLAVRQALVELQRQASQASYQVLYLRQMEGWSVQEVADALGMTSEQVWAREHRMKRKLRELLSLRASGNALAGQVERLW